MTAVCGAGELQLHGGRDGHAPGTYVNTIPSATSSQSRRQQSGSGDRFAAQHRSGSASDKTASAQVVTTGDRVNYAITVAARPECRSARRRSWISYPSSKSTRPEPHASTPVRKNRCGERTHADVDGPEPRRRTGYHLFDGHRGGRTKCDHADQHGDGDRHSARWRQAADRNRDGERSGRGQHVRQLLSDTGRVYLDTAGTGTFQPGDAGIGGVRIYMEDGESVQTDPHGRYTSRAFAQACTRCAWTKARCRTA